LNRPAARVHTCAALLFVVVCRHVVTAADGPVPSRIVSLAPSVTEALFEIGLGPRVVGVTSYCRYPREVLALPKIGGYLTPSYEAIARLRPDLAVVLPEHADVEPHLNALHVPILRIDHRSIDGVIHSLLTLGTNGGATAKATDAANDLRQHIARARQIAGTAARPRVLICFARREDFGQLYAAAPGTIHDDLITDAGGQNVLMSRAVSYPTLSAEAVMRLDPDVIVEFAPEKRDPSALTRQWNVLRSLRAVKSGRVYAFTEDFLSVPGPRMVRFAETIARVLHERESSRVKP
jgi:iron complex transport system substrate-binding protein